MQTTIQKIEVGDIVKIGFEASKVLGIEEGSRIEIDYWYGFVNERGEEVEKMPVIWDDVLEEFVSVKQIFGKDFERFLDCEIVGRKAEDFTIFPYWEWVK